MDRSQTHKGDAMDPVTLDEMLQLVGKKEVELFAAGREVRRLLARLAELEGRVKELQRPVPEGDHA